MEATSREFKGRSLLTALSDYTAIDIETTGLDSDFGDIIELAAIRVRNNTPVAELESLVYPGYEIDSFYTELTGITNDMLKDAPQPVQALQAFLDFIGDDILIAHNANFDINFVYDKSIHCLSTPLKNDFLDTMRFSRRLFPELEHHRLCDILEFFAQPNEVVHRGCQDAMQAHTIYQLMLKYMTEKNISFEAVLPKHKKLQAGTITTQNTEFDSSSPIFGKSFVFTGTLERMPRKEAMQRVVDMGGTITDGVTKKTNYLVFGRYDLCTGLQGKKSSKMIKAEQLKLAGQDIEIITENIFYDMLEE